MKNIIVLLAALISVESAMAEQFVKVIKWNKVKDGDFIVQQCSDTYYHGADILVPGVRSTEKKDFKLSYLNEKDCPLKSQTVIYKNGAPMTRLRFDLKFSKESNCVIQVEELKSGFPSGKVYTLEANDFC